MVSGNAMGIGTHLNRSIRGKSNINLTNLSFLHLVRRIGNKNSKYCTHQNIRPMMLVVLDSDLKRKCLDKTYNF